MRLKKNNTYIIAEIGVNHNGSLSRAKEMILKSKKAGANAVKIQSYVASEVVIKTAQIAKYQKINIKNRILKQYDLLKKYELNFNQQKKLYRFSKLHKIDFLSSAFDLDSLNFIKKLNLRYFKIPSGEITNFQLLSKYSEMKKKIILSTGMSNLNEIRNALNVLLKKKNVLKNITLLACNTDYPTKISDINLRSIKYLKKKFKCNVGYSDHSVSIEAPALAVALGAKVIEKHVTLDRKLSGPDHKASLNFKEFKRMIDLIRKTEIMLGREDKKVSKSENKNIFFSRRSIFAKTKIMKGDIFTHNNLVCKRPLKGVPASKYLVYLGKKSKYNYSINDSIKTQ